MNTDLRRSQRFSDFIAVAVSIMNNAGKTRVKGPFAGRIINISDHGVCLLMSLGSFDSYEMHLSTSKSNDLCLEIEGTNSQKQISLSGRPVWTNPFAIDDLHGFKIGVEFDSQTVENMETYEH